MDCASYVELLMAQKLGFTGQEIMFSSNNTPAEEMVFARQLGATINLDAYEDVAFYSQLRLYRRLSLAAIIQEVFELGTDIMDHPEEAKFGMTKEQLIRAFRELKTWGLSALESMPSWLRIPSLMITIQNWLSNYSSWL